MWPPSACASLQPLIKGPYGGTRDQTANIHWIIEKARKCHKNIYLCFIDYAKIFDGVDHNKLCKTLKEMGIPDHFTCLLRNLNAGQEATIRTLCGTTDWFRIEKGVWQGCLLSLCLFNWNAERIMWSARLDELQAWIKSARRNISNISYVGDTNLTAEKEEELKSLLMRVKEESEKAGLKLNIKKLRSWHPVPSLYGKWKGKRWKQWRISSSWALKSLWMVTAAMKLEDNYFLPGKLW